MESLAAVEFAPVTMTSDCFMGLTALATFKLKGVRHHEHPNSADIFGAQPDAAGAASLPAAPRG